MAAQLEHWAKVARAIEQVVPAATLAEIKGSQDAADVLARLATFLSQPGAAPSRTRLAAAKSPRYGIDEHDPQVAIRIDPDGTETRGAFDAAGNFVPTITAPQKRKTSDARRHKSTQKSGPSTQPKVGSRTRSSRSHSSASAPP